MRQDKVAFMHFRHFKDDQLQPMGGFTIAYRLVPQDNGQVVIEFNHAECGEKEHFNRHIGAAIAKGRLESPRGVVFDFLADADDWFEQFETAILTNTAANDGCKLVNTSRSKSK